MDDLNLTNTAEDVIDAAVIDRNGWQMYGSKKPGCEAYKLTHIYHVEETGLENISPRIGKFAVIR